MDQSIIFIVSLLSLMTTLLSMDIIAAANVNIIRKAFAFLIEYVHGFYIAFFLVGMVLLYFQACFFNRYDLQGLLILNIMYLIVVLQFCLYKLCIANVMFNRLLGIHECTEYYSVTDIIFRRHIPSIEKRAIDCDKQRDKWMNGNCLLIVTLLVLDFLYIYKFPK